MLDTNNLPIALRWMLAVAILTISGLTPPTVAQESANDRANSLAGGLEVSARRVVKKTDDLKNIRKEVNQVLAVIADLDQQGKNRDDLANKYYRLRDIEKAGRLQQEMNVRELEKTIHSANNLLADVNSNMSQTVREKLSYDLHTAKSSIAEFNTWKNANRDPQPLPLPGRNQPSGRLPVPIGPGVTIAPEGFNLTAVENMKYFITLRLTNAAKRTIPVRVFLELPSGDRVTGGSGSIEAKGGNSWTVDLDVPQDGGFYSWSAYAATPDGIVRVVVVEGNFRRN